MERRIARGLLLTALLLRIALPLPGLASRSEQAQVDPDVWAALQDGGEAEVLVVLARQANLDDVYLLPTRETRGQAVYEALRSTAQESQRGLRAWLDARGIKYRSFYIVNALQIRVDEGLLATLAAHPEVDRILPNPAVKGIPDLPVQPLASRATQGIELNLQRVRADDVWALGYTGQGIVVAGQDTGYDWDHPALIGKYRGWDGNTADHDYNWHDAIHTNDPHTAEGNPCGFDSPEPCDDYGSSHGTHTMGIMVGDDGEGAQIGMAPGAQWIGCRNMEQGWGTPASYIECFEFFLAPYPVGGDPELDGDPARAPQVVNNSWACPDKEGCVGGSIALMEASVEALRQAGIVVVASAGNYGPGCGSVKYPPAIYPQTFAVGNFDHRTGKIHVLSSRGPATYGGALYLKPDLSAPGVSIRSSIKGGSYGWLTGTSMAAPHVAGAVALLLSAAPGYSGQVEAVEHLLMTTAEPMTTTEGCGDDGPTDVPNHTWGWGILDVAASVEAVTGVLQGTVSDAEQAVPLMGATVAVDRLTAPQSETNATGHYNLTLAAGVYSVTFQSKGYYARTITGTLVATDTVQILDVDLVPHPRVFLPLIVRN